MRRLVIKDISGNHIGMGCYNISISGNNNTLGNDCGDIIADFGFSDNTFGSDCWNNSFGSDCSGNLFENRCRWNTFGSYCYDNTFGSNCYDNTFGSSVCNLTVHNGVQYVSVTGSSGLLSANTQYAQILNGTHGYYGNPLQITFQRGVSYTQFAALTSSGDLKIWNPADLVPQT